MTLKERDILWNERIEAFETSGLVEMETAKENGLKPLNYLTYLFEQLPNMDIQNPTSIDRILPWSDVFPESCHVSIK